MGRDHQRTTARRRTLRLLHALLARTLAGRSHGRSISPTRQPSGFTPTAINIEAMSNRFLLSLLSVIEGFGLAAGPHQVRAPHQAR
jgi:hypothetical protein